MVAKLAALWALRFPKVKRRGRKLGKGSFGKVYAIDARTVVKVVDLHCRGSGRGALATSWRAHLRKEAEMARVMGYMGVGPHVTAVTERLNRYMLVFMERADGTLANWIQKSHTPQHLAGARRAVEGLFRKMHDAGWYHGDVKAENIAYMIRGDGRVRFRLIDFGWTHRASDGPKTGFPYAKNWWLAGKRDKYLKETLDGIFRGEPPSYEYYS
jgi:predicted Ser/Thr protein kinase